MADPTVDSPRGGTDGGRALQRKRVPLSEQAVGDLKVDTDMVRYMEDLVANGKTRLEAVRKTSEAAEFLERVRADERSLEVDSPWSCSKQRPPERDHTVNKSLSNKDTTVGTLDDIQTMRHYRSKLTDIWTAAYANELEEVDLYLGCGCDANARNSLLGNGETPLHNAALGGHLEMVELLVQNGQADVDAQDNVGNTPLHMAARAGHYDTALRLLDFNAKATIKNDSLHTAWLEAHTHGHIKLRDQLPKPQNYSVRAAGKTADGGSKVKLSVSKTSRRTKRR